MAYNREWDKGKQPDYSDYGSWQSGPKTGNDVHSRDDDYYGDSKRRKFNDGVRSLRIPHILLERLAQCQDAGLRRISRLRRVRPR